MTMFGVCVGIFGLLTVLLYYIIVWFMVGGGFRKKVVVPLYHPPKNMSPAEMRFINRMEYDKLCLTASIIQMKIANVIDVKRKGKSLLLTLTGKSDEKLSAVDRDIKNHIFTSNQAALLNTIDQTEVEKIIERGVLERYGSPVFNVNRPYSMKGFVLIIAIFFVTAAFSGDSTGANNELALLFILFLVFWGMFLTIMFFAMMESWKMVYYGEEGRARALFLAGLTTAFEVALFVPVIHMMNQVLITGAWIVVAQIPIAVCIYFIFYELLKVRTDIGWEIMDHLSGFGMFLRATEEIRLEMLSAEGIERLDFDTYLPYAIALGIYKEEWVRRFNLLYDGGKQDSFSEL